MTLKAPTLVEGDFSTIVAMYWQISEKLRETGFHNLTNVL